MGYSVQTKALFFIFLIVGQEAARVSTVQQLYVGGPNATSAEQMKEADKACQWWNTKMACADSSGNKEPCSWRFLPLDGLPPVSSQGCRLTDEYMMTTDRAKFVRLQAGIVAEKSDKYAENCKRASVANLYCMRRARQMFRAMTFMGKAQDASLVDSLDEEDRAEEQRLMDQSWHHMSKFAGDDAQYVATLREKIEANKEGFRADPVKSVKEVMSILTKLLRGDDKEKADARRAIQDWEGESGAPADERALAEEVDESKTTVIQELDGQSGDLNKEPTPDEAALLNLTSAGGEASSALIESHLEALMTLKDDKGMKIAKGIGVVVFALAFVAAIIWLIIPVLIGLFATLFLAMIGCGIYEKMTEKDDEDEGSFVEIGSNASQPNHAAEGLGEVGSNCVMNVLAAPFIATYAAGRKVYRFVFPKSNSSSHLQQFQQLEALQKHAQKATANHKKVDAKVHEISAGTKKD